MSARTYSVGVPAVITIGDNGKITIDVDLSETDLAESSEVNAAWATGEYVDLDTIAADQAVVDEAIANPTIYARALRERTLTVVISKTN